jgi:hypothetical protein
MTLVKISIGNRIFIIYKSRRKVFNEKLLVVLIVRLYFCAVSLHLPVEAFRSVQCCYASANVNTYGTLGSSSREVGNGLKACG